MYKINFEVKFKYNFVYYVNVEKVYMYIVLTNINYL